MERNKESLNCFIGLRDPRPRERTSGVQMRQFVCQQGSHLMYGERSEKRESDRQETGTLEPGETLMESCGGGHIVMKMDVIGDGRSDQIGDFVSALNSAGWSRAPIRIPGSSVRSLLGNIARPAKKATAIQPRSKRPAP